MKLILSPLRSAARLYAQTFPKLMVLSLLMSFFGLMIPFIQQGYENSNLKTPLWPYFIGFVVTVLGTAVIARFLSEAHLQKAPTIRGTLNSAGRHVGPYLFYALVGYGALALGLVLGIVPGLWFAPIGLFVVISTLVETRPYSPFTLASRLVKGRAWAALAVIVLGTAPSFIYLLTERLPLPSKINDFLTTLIGVFITPYVWAIYVSVYHEARQTAEQEGRLADLPEKRIEGIPSYLSSVGLVVLALLVGFLGARWVRAEVYSDKFWKWTSSYFEERDEMVIFSNGLMLDLPPQWISWKNPTVYRFDIYNPTVKDIKWVKLSCTEESLYPKRSGKDLSDQDIIDYILLKADASGYSQENLKVHPVENLRIGNYQWRRILVTHKNSNWIYYFTREKEDIVFASFSLDKVARSTDEEQIHTLLSSLRRTNLRRSEINGDEMEPTFFRGDKVLHKSADGVVINRGDIVRYKVDHEPDTRYTMRVVGMPGERLEFRRARIFADGKPIRIKNGPLLYNTPDLAIKFGRTVTVPPNSYFVVQDNFLVRPDRKFFGPVRRDNITQVPIEIYAPPSRRRSF